MRIAVDREVCIGSGNCVMSLPAVFDQDDEGLVVLLEPVPDAAVEEDVRAAVLRCPSGAITVHDQ